MTAAPEQCERCQHAIDMDDPDDDLLLCRGCGRWTCTAHCCDPEFGRCHDCWGEEAEKQGDKQ